MANRFGKFYPASFYVSFKLSGLTFFINNIKSFLTFSLIASMFSLCLFALCSHTGMEYNNGEDTSFSSPGANRSYPSPSAGDNPQRRATDEQTLIPVTISMLVSAAQNNKVLLDGREPHHVKVVAAVTAVQMGSTSYTYTVEDGTGSIDVKEWLDEGNIEVSRMREEAAVEHQYVRIIGKLEEYGEKPQIVAHAVRKLANCNELTYHFLEVVYEGEKYKQSQQIVGSPSYAMGNMNFGGNIPMQASRPIINGGQGDGEGLVDDIKSFLAGRECTTRVLFVFLLLFLFFL
jgi:hypothetical protein